MVLIYKCGARSAYEDLHRQLLACPLARQVADAVKISRFFRNEVEYLADGFYRAANDAARCLVAIVARGTAKEDRAIFGSGWKVPLFATGRSVSNRIVVSALTLYRSQEDDALQTSEKTHIETAPVFDRYWFIAQKILQSLMAFTLCAGLLGIFGGGWLSSETVRFGSFEVTYQKFVRKSVPFKIRLRPLESIGADTLQVFVGRELIDKAAIVRTVPTALSSSETAEGTLFEFGVSPQAPGEIVIAIQPDQFGLFRWTIRAAGAAEASLFQIIYP